MNFWAVILAIGLVTYLTRLSFIGVVGTRPLPHWAERPLSFVAPSVLAALALPAVVLPDATVDVTPDGNPRFLAAIAATLVAWRFKNMAAVFVVGMTVLWTLQGLF